MIYMSPEMLASPQEITPSTDNWSAGITLYELFRGKPPFLDPNLRQKIQNPALKPDFKDLPDKRAELLRGLLTRDPAKRLRAADGKMILAEPKATK